MRGVIAFTLGHRFLVLAGLVLLTLWGLAVAPFDSGLPGLPRAPGPMDAIPDLGENQQIVFASWPGHAPEDVQTSVTQPLMAALMGLPGVRTVRGTSEFGYASLYVLFDDGFDPGRSRGVLLERLASFAPGTLPAGVAPSLGPGATTMGQIFWYTIQARTPSGVETGGWEPWELRMLQDSFVKPQLESVRGVAEVASIGGVPVEYQIALHPERMREFGVPLRRVLTALAEQTGQVGARTLEMNGVEYVVRAAMASDSLADLRAVGVPALSGVIVPLAQFAEVRQEPALRRGALDRDGVAAVGGIVVAQLGENPLEVIQRVRQKLAELAPAMPERVFSASEMTRLMIVPYYDRAELIGDNLRTVRSTLVQEVLITILVITWAVLHLRISLAVSFLLPLSLLTSFILMKQLGVQANVMALAGLAIAIGEIADVGIVICENMLRRLAARAPGERTRDVVLRATEEVSGPLITAVLATVVSFIPVLALTGAEGKLFRPLALTKTFALLGAAALTLLAIPAIATVLLGSRTQPDTAPPSVGRRWFVPIAVLLIVAWLLRSEWTPLGPDRSQAGNLLALTALLGIGLLFFRACERAYPTVLRWCLAHKGPFLLAPGVLLVLGVLAFRSIGHDFMPRLDEGSFLYMPSAMPHVSFAESLSMLHTLDAQIAQVPEVAEVVGKVGRAESALDPAPISMLEVLIRYRDEYEPGADGRIARRWRPEVRSPGDIFEDVLAVADVPGLTSAPRLGPIEARIVMLQSGIRARFGIKVKGPNQEVVERTSTDLARLLRDVPQVRSGSIFAERALGKPYLDVELERSALTRYRLTAKDVLELFEVAVGGRVVGSLADGMGRTPVSVRYQRDFRADPDAIARLVLEAPDGTLLQLRDVAQLRTRRGPEMIRSEDGSIVNHVLFEGRPQYGSLEVVVAARHHLHQQLLDDGLTLAPGVSYAFAGEYENQLRAQQQLALVIPATLAIIFVILYLQFRALTLTLIVFGGVFLAWAGGFLMLAAYGTPWFLDVTVLGANLRDLLNIQPYQLTVAVWIGFLSLFGVAVDDGVLVGSYVQQSVGRLVAPSRQAIRDAVLEAARRRIRPALMTTATTLFALVPVLLSRGRGAEIMAPMAVPIFGGMMAALITVLTVPTLYCWIYERRAAGTAGA